MVERDTKAVAQAEAKVVSLKQGVEQREAARQEALKRAGACGQASLLAYVRARCLIVGAGARLQFRHGAMAGSSFSLPKPPCHPAGC